MKVMVEIQARSKRLIFPAALLFVLVYTYYQMLTGERGLLIWYQLNQQVEELTQQNTALEERAAFMENRVERLSVDAPDLDYIDELARRSLPLMNKDEVVIFIK